MQNQAYIDEYLDAVKRIAETISRPDIDQFVESIFAAWRDGRTIFIMGNGGSASTATHFAADLNKVTAVPGQRRIRAFSLVDNIPWVSALTNDEGWENVYMEQLRNLFQWGDVLVGISVHGGNGQDQSGPWSQNLLKAMQYAKESGGVTIGFSGFDGGAMKDMADVCVVVPDNTTPHVESFHVELFHLVAFCIAEKIRSLSGTPSP